MLTLILFYQIKSKKSTLFSKNSDILHFFNTVFFRYYSAYLSSMGAPYSQSISRLPSFLQTSPHDGHTCLRLTVPHTRSKWTSTVKSSPYPTHLNKAHSRLSFRLCALLLFQGVYFSQPLRYRFVHYVLFSSISFTTPCGKEKSVMIFSVSK